MNSGKQSSTSGVRLTVRDREILTRHFPTYRITTHEALHLTRWPQAEIDAVKKWTLRMRDAGYIAEAPLWSDATSYFRLTPKATEEFRLPPIYGRPLSPTQLARAYGVLSFCVLGPKSFRKLLPAEFRKEFPPLVSNRFEDDYYYLDIDFQEDGWPKARRIGYIYVDAGKRVQDVVQRCRKVIAQRQLDNAWHHGIIRKHLFIYAVVTLSTNKREQILEDLSLDRRKGPIRVEVREDLRHVCPTQKPSAPENDDNP